jgi:hypothetical protein
MTGREGLPPPPSRASPIRKRGDSPRSRNHDMTSGQSEESYVDFVFGSSIALPGKLPVEPIFDCDSSWEDHGAAEHASEHRVCTGALPQDDLRHFPMQGRRARDVASLGPGTPQLDPHWPRSSFRAEIRRYGEPPPARRFFGFQHPAIPLAAPGDPANCCIFGHIRHNWSGATLGIG